MTPLIEEKDYLDFKRHLFGIFKKKVNSKTSARADEWVLMTDKFGVKFLISTSVGSPHITVQLATMVFDNPSVERIRLSTEDLPFSRSKKVDAIFNDITSIGSLMDEFCKEIRKDESISTSKVNSLGMYFTKEDDNIYLNHGGSPKISFGKIGECPGDYVDSGIKAQVLAFMREYMKVYKILTTSSRKHDKALPYRVHEIYRQELNKK